MVWEISEMIFWGLYPLHPASCHSYVVMGYSKEKYCGKMHDESENKENL